MHPSLSFSARLLRSPLTLGAGAAALAVIAYAWSLSFPLVWDDPTLIGKAVRAEAEGGVGRFFSQGYSTSRPDGYYRPLIPLSFWADSRLGGGAPFAYHLTNVLLHAANAFLLFLLLRRLVPSPGAAAWGAALFAVHPLHVEVAAFVSNRSDSWSAFFLLLSALAFLCWAQGREAGSPWPPALLGGGALFLAALCKEPAFLFPAALLAVAGLEAGRPPFGPRARRGLVPWVAALGGAVAAALLLRTALARVGWGAEGPAGPPGALLERGLALGAHLAGLLTLPLHQQALYTSGQSSPTAAAWAGVLLLGLVTAGTVKAAGWRRAAAALAWMAIFLLPYVGLVPLNAAPLAERYFYLPALGFSLLAASALSPALERGSPHRRWALAAAAGVIALLLLLTVVRTGVWSSEARLFRHLGEVAPDAAIAQVNRGIILVREGRSDEAMESFRRALAWDPASPEVNYNLAVELMKAGRWGEAETHFRRARDFPELRAVALFGLGLALAEQGKAEEARQVARELGDLSPARARELAARLPGP